MCRLVAYIGYDILLADVLVKPEDSLVKQSLRAKESSVPTNGDGFGVGWYMPQISVNPSLFLSVSPAWNDENLLHLTAKIKSSLFFAHVRAASIGGVNNYNCHPFIHKNWMFMHNGSINDFLAIKRPLRNLLDNDLYNWIRGETDSEHFFALFLQLSKGKDMTNLSIVADVLQTTFDTVAQLLKKFGKPGASYYNICLTDGHRILASRYCTEKSIEPESLHYLEGRYFWSKTEYLKEIKTEPHYCVVVASEMLTDFNSQWRTVPANHLLLIEKDYTIQIRSI